MASRRARGLRLGNSLLLLFRAGACLRAARIEEGLTAADLGLTHCRETTERCFEAELWRLKGELVLRRAPARGHARQVASSEAKTCFDNARAVSRAQGGHMLE